MVKHRLKHRAGCILILNKEGDHFLSVSGKSGKDFNLPGGKIEYNESYIDGSIRELREETGLIVNKRDLKLLHQNFDIGRGLRWYVITYIAFDWYGTIHTEETGIVKWLPLEELKNSQKWEVYNTKVYENYMNKYNFTENKKNVYIPPHKRVNYFTKINRQIFNY